VGREGGKEGLGQIEHMGERCVRERENSTVVVVTVVAVCNSTCYVHHVNINGVTVVVVTVVAVCNSTSHVHHVNIKGAIVVVELVVVVLLPLPIRLLLAVVVVVVVVVLIVVDHELTPSTATLSFLELQSTGSGMHNAK